MRDTLILTQPEYNQFKKIVDYLIATAPCFLKIMTSPGNMPYEVVMAPDRTIISSLRKEISLRDYFNICLEYITHHNTHIEDRLEALERQI